MRRELKYPVSIRDLPALRRSLEPYLAPDRFAVTAADGAYTVRSLYYDTPAMTYYRNKVDGVERRRKVRIRVYNESADDAVAFLEVKHKQGLHVSKSRAPVRAEALERVLAAGDARSELLPLPGHPMAAEHADHFFYYYRSAFLRPAALIVYDRIAYQGAFDPSFRLTLDFDLRAATGAGVGDLYRDRGLVRYLEGLCVVEVKCARGLPASIAAVLARYDLRRSSVSKYCLGMDAARVRRRIPAP